MHVPARALLLAVLVLTGGAALALPAPSAPEAPALRVLAWFETEDDLRAYLPEVAGRPGFRLASLPVLVFDATAAEAAALAQRAGVRRVEADQPQPLHLATATTATRARAVWGTLLGGPLHDPESGAVIDGSGVGVAVVDTGIDATHPDLADRVARNFKLATGTVFWDILLGHEARPALFLEAPDTDDQGHGTHVAGIVAGTGLASGGVARGVAPGATLYGFGANVGLHMWQTEAAYDWILQNHDKVDPPIRVVTNSYGCATRYDPGSLKSALVDQLVAKGIVVTWSAGNGDALGDGGDGSDDRTNGCAESPTPGVIGVANYDDRGAGTREGALAPSSSRGLATDPATWPDVSAPGTTIHAAFAPTGLTAWPNKAYDAFGTLYGGPNANPFGAFINQHSGTAAFRFGDATTPPRNLDWILYLQPTLVYNAHRDRFATTPLFLPGVDAAEMAQARLHCGAPAPAGPFAGPGQSQRAVQPGDALLLTKASGTANPIKLQVLAPSCGLRQVTVAFPCERGCAAEVDLHALFPGAPSDGTWILMPGRTVDPRADGTAGPEESVHYVGLTGTSMASPHVAGVAALMLQANPALTPAQVEDILEDTAYKFAAGAPYEPDPRNPGGTSSFDKGHGLVDAKAAVEAALALRAAGAG